MPVIWLRPRRPVGRRTRCHPGAALPVVCFLLVILPSSAAVPNPGPDPSGSESLPSQGDEAGAILRLLREGRYPEAEEAARRHLEWISAVAGPDSLEAARATDLVVRTLLFGSRPSDPESLRLAERAVAAKEKLLGADHPDLVVSLRNLGRLLGYRSDYTRARPLLERARGIQEKALGPDDPEVAETLFVLATVLESTGDFVAAKPLYERTLSIQEKTSGPESLEVAQTLNGFASLLRTLGDYPAALALRERCLAIREQILGPAHPQVAWSQHNLANLLMDMGDLPRAEALYERALTIRESALPAEHPDLGYSHNSLGLLLQALGDYAGARQHLERALAIREKAFGPDHPQVAFSLNNLANLLRLIGDGATALPLFQRSLEIKAKTLGPEHPDLARGLDNVGNVLLDLGDLVGAKPFLERSLTIREGALGPEHPEVAWSLNDLGFLLLETGDLDGAQKLLERALAIRRKSLGDDHPELASTLGNLGLVLESRGDFTGAQALQERALAIREKVLDAGHPDLARSLGDLALLHRNRGENGKALENALRAEAIGREHFRRTARTLAGREALGYRRSRVSGLDLALSILTLDLDLSGRGEWARRVLDELILSRAMVLDEMAARQRVARDPDSAGILPEVEALSRARNRLASLVVSGPEEGRPGNYREDLRKAVEEKERRERSLAEKSALFRHQVERSRVGLSEVSESLPQGTRLVSFVQYRRVARAGRGPLQPDAREVPCYAAFVLRADGSVPVVISLGPAERIDSLIRGWRREVAVHPPGPSGAGRQAEARYRRAGEGLRRAIWDPLAGPLAGAVRVLLVPDGSLSLISFAALPSGRDRYLVETGPILHYLSAERDLAAAGGEAPRGNGLLALGAPDFGELLPPPTDAAKPTPPPLLASCGGSPPLDFGPLPGTEAEVEEIASLWSGSGPGREADGVDVWKMTGPGAGETAFKRLARGRRVLHLATHGYFLDDGCLAPADGGPDPSERAASGGMEISRSLEDNPLLRSGLALSGANTHRQPGAGGESDDGILTAEEIASMDLSAVDWVVLSACETGMGALDVGEGVLGLRRAFETAGSATLITSLWSVQDAATREWMRALYEERFGGASTADSVRRASVRLIEARRHSRRNTHPYYWGAFVAFGDWR